MMTIEEGRQFYAREVLFFRQPDNCGSRRGLRKTAARELPGPGTVATGVGGGRSDVRGRNGAVVLCDRRGAIYSSTWFVSADRAKDINNGQPGALARWIDALAPKTGECVYHLGCGVGYSTAIIAETVGPTGTVVGIELQPELAAEA